MSRHRRDCLGCKFQEESKRRAKPIPTVLLTNPLTDCVDLTDFILRFAANIGSPVSVKRVILDKSIPVGRVLMANTDEPWVKGLK